MSLTGCHYCGKAFNDHDSTYDPKQCAFAMGQLLRRLAVEGYVHCERIPELLERATNLERNRGFLTNAELEKQAPTPTPTEEELLS